MKLICYRDVNAVNTMLFELLCLRRWSELTVSNGRFTELAKQALNSMVAYFWAIEAKHAGYDVDLTKFPKLAIYRGFTKTVQCDIPEGNLEQILELGHFTKVDLTEMVDKTISKSPRSVSALFLKFLKVNDDSLEYKIFRAATKVATLLEFKDLHGLISVQDYEKKLNELTGEVQKFRGLPGFDQIMSEDYQEIFRNFSKLRNRIRWAKHPNIVQCSVMGHLYDVACFAYLMSLVENPEDESLATTYYFMGIFHDFPEAWTGDMPSPIKDGMKGLRKATEEFENRVLNENVYNHLPDYMVNSLKNVMLEDPHNSHLKPSLKKSDVLAAYVECWREIDAGSHHSYYKEVIERDYPPKELLPSPFGFFMKHLYISCHTN